MTSALSPPSALERLSEMSGHVREAIVLDAAEAMVDATDARAESRK